MADTPSERLDQLHAGIPRCVDCETLVGTLVRPPPLDRGAATARVMIVGQAPGGSEVKKGRPFAGVSGSRLDDWLAKSGGSRTDVYMTSVLKCVCPNEGRFFRAMASNCRRFLNGQLAIIKPSLLITLGGRAYDELSVTRDDFRDAVCKSYDTRQHLLIPPSGHHYTLLVWPHPSGLNRWLNNPLNIARLELTFPLVAAHLQGDS